MSLYPWQAETWQRLHAQRGRLPHALLLEGARGIGKRDFALAFAKGMLCESPAGDGAACGRCASCHWFEQGSHPDLRLIEPITEDEEEGEEGGTSRKRYEIAIAQIRALADFVNLSSHRGRGRVIVLHPAESLNLAASNALLKTLEEPAPNTQFLLVTHQPHAVLATIKSRAQRLTLPKPDAVASRAWLEKSGMKQAELCLALAGGAPLLAKEFDDAEYLAERQQFLGALREPAKLNWLALAEQGAKANLAARFDWLQKWLYDLSCAQLAGTVRYNIDFATGLRDLSTRVNVTRVQSYARELAQQKRHLQHPLNPQLLLESVLLRYRDAVTG